MPTLDRKKTMTALQAHLGILDAPGYEGLVRRDVSQEWGASRSVRTTT